jgi:hypothetical protein
MSERLGGVNSTETWSGEATREAATPPTRGAALPRELENAWWKRIISGLEQSDGHDGH